MFAVLFDSHPHGLVLLGSDGSIIDANSRALELTGYSRREITAIRGSDLFRDDLFDRTVSHLSEHPPEVPFIMESLVIDKNGGEVPVLTGMTVFHDGGELFMYINFRDLTAEREAAAERERLERQLDHARKLGVIGELAGGITHYYNNVFTGLLGTLGVLKREADGDLLPLLKRAENMANTASGFSRSLLGFSRSGEARLEPVNVGALIDSVEEFAALTFDRRYRMEISGAAGLPCVLADPAALHHALLNLIVNARDALSERERSSGIMERPVIAITADHLHVDGSTDVNGVSPPRGNYVRIRVSDNGCGMDGDTLERAFDPFFTTKPTGTGTGLGLASVRKAVEENGGWAGIESEPGAGTSVTIHLPSTTLNHDASGSRHSDDDDLPGGGETLLVVDDDEMIRTLAVMTLEGLGYRVLNAGTGRQGLDCFLTEHATVKLALVDLMLPDIPGDEVISSIRRVTPGICVVVTSGHDMGRDPAIFKRIAADDVIVKPFTISDLAFSVRGALDRAALDAR